MRAIQEFIEELAAEDLRSELRVSLQPDGRWGARIADPDQPNSEILDRNGDRILAVVRDQPEEAIKALDALCAVR